MYKYYLITTNRVTLKKSISYFKNNLIDGEEMVSPRPLPQTFDTSNIIYTKVKVDSKIYKKLISFNQYSELTENEYLKKVEKIEYKW